MKDIKVFYWLGEPNFGDMLNIEICRNIFKVNPVEAQPEYCEAVFIGSVLDDFLYPNIFKNDNYIKLYNQDPVKIWGSGFITEKNGFIKRKLLLPELFFRRIEVYSVRGLYSLLRLKKISKTSIDCSVLADPGLLASFLIEKNEKKYKIGIIPHHTELDMDVWKNIKQSDEIKIIRVDNFNTLETIKQISECENIFSSALHGLIVADSLGVPNIRLKVSNRLLGGDYKFKDYYSSYNIYEHPFIGISDFIYQYSKIKNLKNIVSFEMVEFKQKQLLSSFPFI